MRVTQQVLRSKASGPLQAVEYLDLSNLGIVSIEKINVCPKLTSLNLRGNLIVEVSNLEQNRNLWRLDLSNNNIEDLDCLNKFVALGSLNLANNALNWSQVGRLRNVYILELSLHGNKQLEKDPYYRIHIIDCLPHVWMLDGRIITSAERLQVKHFFADSALTDRPIRRKLSKEWFVPSSLQKMIVNGVYGEKTTQLMMRFPANELNNIDSDQRRLKYLAQLAQDDLILEKKYTKRDFSVLKYRRTFIEDILEARVNDKEKCNMLLLLIVATLEFVMPTHLVKETLDVAKLSKIGKVYTMDLFLLPKDIRCRIVCILLGAVKIDKDAKEVLVKQDGGLYDRLYLCLFYTVAELSKLSNSIFSRNNAPKVKITQIYRDYKCLLASEVVQLLCIVPAFFEYIERDVDLPGALGVMNMLVTATGDVMIAEKVANLSLNVQQSGGDIKKVYEEVSDFLLQLVQEQSMNLSNKSHRLSTEDQAITTTRSFPMQNEHRSPLTTAEFHMKGITSPNLDPPTVLSARLQNEKSRKHFPHLGDYLLMGPQTLGKVIGLPQPFVAHVAMDLIPVANGAMESKLRESEDHYTYVNMDQFDYDTELGFWKPIGSIGDKFTIHTIEDIRKELNRRSNLAGDHTTRPNSPVDVGRRPLTGRESAPPSFRSVSQQQLADQTIAKTSPNGEFSPRPMTTVLKEKFDLKLDMDAHQRIQPSSSRMSFSPRSDIADTHLTPRPMTAMAKEKEDMKPEGSIRRIQSARGTKSPRTTNTTSEKQTLSAIESDNTVLSSESATATTPECVGCTTIVEDGTTTPIQQAEKGGKEEEEEDVGDERPSEDVEVPTERELPPVRIRDTNPLGGGRAEDFEGDSPAGSTRQFIKIDNSKHNHRMEPELRNRSQRPASAPGMQQMSLSTKHIETQHIMRRLNPSVKVNIPQMDLSDDDSDMMENFSRPLVLKGVSSHYNRTTMSKNMSRKQALKCRPYSAMDAYKYILDQRRKPGNSADYNTLYQQQRTDAWRQTTINTDTPTPTPRKQQIISQDTPDKSPEPAAHTKMPINGITKSASMISSQRPGSSHPGMAVQRGSDWLAGGRDLYWESLQNRPRSGHVPGWKEGLPDNMKPRPKSAAAVRTSNRQSKKSAPVTPSSLKYEAIMQGTHLWSPRSIQYLKQLPPDMLDLSDYEPMYSHQSGPRQLGAHEQPTHDIVYRWS